MDHAREGSAFFTDSKIKAEQKAAEQRMKDLTKEYKAAKKKCLSNALTTFRKKDDGKKAKEALERKCIDGYTE
ncbi:hypothetical protein E8E12_001921 [Didymella heteroderae]|uniref:Uncharacterized protein n=1 Tax=Didymella heteroderae TaxID=1769908 RepID=A0A9P5C1V0_9PLEO|nr:hypothetical protein E8E12_001921 [Didymella heteroderae]